jgi:hypothetical protein
MVDMQSLPWFGAFFAGRFSYFIVCKLKAIYCPLSFDFSFRDPVGEALEKLVFHCVISLLQASAAVFNSGTPANYSVKMLQGSMLLPSAFLGDITRDMIHVSMLPSSFSS